MPYSTNKPIEIELDNKGLVKSIKGETSKGKKGFLEQMEELKEMFNNGTN